jgi:hypothetical protein
MPQLQRLTLLSEPARPEALCRGRGHTCGACCWGEAVSRDQLAERLRRQTWWFERLAPPGRSAARVRLLLLELIVRGGLDLLLAPILWLPWIGPWLGARLHRSMSCAFLGYTDEAHEQIGCLLHPSRWRGVDQRHLAFGLLAGLACGRKDFFCLAAWRFAHARPRDQAAFLKRVRDADWFGYSKAAARFSA